MLSMQFFLNQGCLYLFLARCFSLSAVDNIVSSTFYGILLNEEDFTFIPYPLKKVCLFPYLFFFVGSIVWKETV